MRLTEEERKNVGKTHEESMKAAFKLARESGGKFINGHDHIDIMAGAGTIALEVLEEVKDLDAILVPVGSGGLLAGITVAVKHAAPNVKVIGLESETCPTFMIVLEGAGAIGPAALLAGNIEGLAGKRVACILSGGNIESSMIGQTIEKGDLSDRF
ncbi:hypothetical protein TELCIR_04829 [Teladorsagia circumcincta]|uniref:L-serine deaminase n=1 Tax=Teladorsagia circumcincta TaxID=45464 RepID=A0A2G9USS5_TELCI|nr:hypothetical protein TELCIR_04829 [Teladorsagia circumcincta]